MTSDTRHTDFTLTDNTPQQRADALAHLERHGAVDVAEASGLL